MRLQQYNHPCVLRVLRHRTLCNLEQERLKTSDSLTARQMLDYRFVITFVLLTALGPNAGCCGTARTWVDIVQ